jgi:hypothetical protein
MLVSFYIDNWLYYIAHAVFSIYKWYYLVKINNKLK